MLSLFACANDAITDETVNTPTVTDEPIKEIKMAQGEIACIASGYIDVYTGEKMYASMGFIFDENSTTIKTNDYVDLKEGDLIEFQEEIWFVKSCQEKKVNKNRQFMKKPMKFSYIQIKR